RVAKGERLAVVWHVGDRVAAGQLLAVLWSKDLGVKKADLVDALARLHLSREPLRRLQKVYEEGGGPLATLRRAEREVKADENAAHTAERTLRMWKLTDDEIAAIRREAGAVVKNGAKRDPEAEKRWARLEIRSPLAGILLERNVHVGDVVTPDTLLFV